MCDWCEKFGEGMEWHFNPANYARRLYKIRKEEKVAAGPEAAPAAGLASPETVIKLGELKDTGEMEEYERLVKEEEDRSWRVHFGQVVTIDEVLKATDLMYPIARMACGCRRGTQGLPDEENFTCIGMGPGMYKWERWPESYPGGVEFMHPDDARDFLIKLNKRGYVQTFFTFGTPFIGGICNCEYPDCTAIRLRLDYDLNSLWKGHQVAKVDPNLCTGCGLCTSRCQFRALNINPTRNVAHIEMAQCFGCGQCLNACKADAITLVTRQSLPALAQAW